MEVILLEKVENLGGVGDRVAVRPGFARNYLLPRRMALAATPDNIAAVEARRAELERAAADAVVAAKSKSGSLDGVVITIARKAGGEGKLFGSVGTADVAEALAAAVGFPVEKQQVRMPAGSLRELGEYEVLIHLHADVNATIKVNVVPEA
jgi:large subunit ribosomal protein L9